MRASRKLHHCRRTRTIVRSGRKVFITHGIACTVITHSHTPLALVRVHPAQLLVHLLQAIQPGVTRVTKMLHLSKGPNKEAAVLGTRSKERVKAAAMEMVLVAVPSRAKGHVKGLVRALEVRVQDLGGLKTVLTTDLKMAMI